MTSPCPLKITLEQLYANRSQQHLANDPLSFCHRYRDTADQEIAALIAAVFAYGSVKVIKGSLSRIFDIMGDSPAAFVDGFDPKRHKQLCSGFKHRFNNGDDLAALFWAIRLMRQQCGSIEGFYCQFHAADAITVEQGLNGFCAAVLGLDYRPIFGRSGLPQKSSFSFLFPAPAGGSACKRLCMFLRWVVRPADGIDLELWQQVRPAQLIIPVDRHIERIGRMLGLTSRHTPDWRMASEITVALRLFDPQDPVKYDFSLCHLGISEGCNGTRSACCQTCPVAQHCSRA
ncbi:MAG: TIGR02757 family protein [Trichlorobacter sp.]|uniref:TIGR02757 family protein n=1 Tax=Trichlorobacter sp. TaxID=2911007 RepID=UPI002560E664|nr:TIGR02757 family protein [Trichlorobacter sp.]MDK9717245.1 TIGR02757 family protein [Trichlorobacter sp.]